MLDKAIAEREERKVINEKGEANAAQRRLEARKLEAWRRKHGR